MPGDRRGATLLALATRAAALAAGTCTVISQSLTLQRSLRQVAVIDWIGLLVLGILMPIAGTVALARRPGGWLARDGRGWVLGAGAVLQASFLVAWPAHVVPGTLVVIAGGTLVHLSGAWIQAGILGVAILLATQCVVAWPGEGGTGPDRRGAVLAAGTGGGVLLAGAGMYLASCCGWTVHVLPSLLAMLAAGLAGAFLSRPGHDAGTGGEVAIASPVTPPPGKPAGALLWASVVFASVPFLLLATTFQRHRYAPGYFPSLLVLGAALLVATVGSLVARRARDRAGGAPRVAWRGALFMAIAAGGASAVPLAVILASPAGVAAAYVASPWHWCILVAATLAGWGGLVPALVATSFVNERGLPAGKRVSNALLGGTLPALVVVIFLFQGTSMIFSWSFTGQEPAIVTGAINALGWVLVVVAACRARATAT